MCAKFGGPQSQRNGPHTGKTDDKFYGFNCRGPCFCHMCALARIPDILPCANSFSGLNLLSLIALCLNRTFLWVKHQAVVT